MSTTHADPIHAKYPHLAHHFDTPKQQFDSGKMGMWLFLITEILFFGGLFAAYFVLRSNNYQMFHIGQYFLDTNMGLINTIVLLVSSFTAAWSVRAAQMGNKKLMIQLMAVTFLCAAGFMVIKYFEYSHKIHWGLVWGSHFAPSQDALAHLAKQGYEYSAEQLGASGMRLGNFFSLYFCITGLHGIHVLVGMGLYLWLIKRAMAGHFNKDNFAAVDNVALYWHIVDIIWIFLFPMLYLIG